MAFNHGSCESWMLSCEILELRSGLKDFIPFRTYRRRKRTCS
jgi:hypothetical protein